MSVTYNAYRKPLEVLMSCGIGLKVDPETVCTACRYMHRLKRCNTKTQSYDLYLMAAAALYLASKVTENALKLSDVIQEFYQTIHKTDDELEDTTEPYKSLKESIANCELLLLRMLGFKVDAQPQHRYLNIYLQTLANWMRDDPMATKLETSAFALINDYLCLDGRSMDYRPQHIAIAVIELSLRCLNYHIPYNDEALISWHEAFDDQINAQDINEVIQQIESLYNNSDGSNDGHTVSTTSSTAGCSSSLAI